MKRTVVITGVGMVTPLGETTEQSWDGLVSGKNGVVSISGWESPTTGKMPATIAGLVPAFDATKWVPSLKDVKRGDRFIQLAFAAAHQAWVDSGLPERLEDPEASRAGAIVGVGFGGIGRLLEEHHTMLRRGAARVSAYSVPAVVSNMAPGNIAIRYNLRGPNFAIASACASGAHAIGEAFMQVRSGRCDVVLAGGAEAPVTPLTIGGFASAGALCVSHNGDPTHASRPFDRGRDGFVLGEGSGMLILEELEHARARGGRIYAELAGYGATCDAWHATMPSPEGEGAARAMKEALDMAELPSSDIGYINAHGTSTRPNDHVETRAIKMAFGAWAKDGLLASSTKSMIGHLLGAAGGVEAVITALAIRHGTVPPTTNYDEPDPACDLDYVPNTARRVPVAAALSNCFGFGGTNAVLAFKRA
jgi:3-oxoacyl-[acyl-carrier-protein] synthase II